MRQVEVKIDQTGPGHGVARDTRGTIIEDAVMIIVASGGDVDRLTRIERQPDSQREEFRQLCRCEQVELVQAVIVGASPIGRRVVAVRRKECDATGVVIGAAQRVLDLAGEIFAGFASKS